MKDGAGLTAVANIPITVGNRAPVVTIEFPKDGQVASFTDKVNYKISVSDPEDGTTGDGIYCADVRVDVSLGHDEHAHTLSSTTGCTGTFNTGLTSGHGAEANTFTVLGVSYTDKGAAGAPALTGRAQAILQPKTKQAEFFASTGRVADGGTNGDAGVTKETTDRHRGRWPEHRLHRGRRLRLLQAVQPRGHHGHALPRGVRRCGRHDRGAPGLPDRHARGHHADDHADGRLADVQDVSLHADAARRPGRTSCSSCSATRGSTQNLFNVNWFEFVGKGAATTASPDVTATATPLTGTAPLNVKFDAHGDRPRGQATHVRVGLRRARHHHGHLHARRIRATRTRRPAPTRPR